MRVVVMGVAGSGKSTVGKLLAARLGVPYGEADDLHPAANVAKMAAGQPLDDVDRAPWLEAIARWLDVRPAGVVTCSALKRAYRDVLRRPGVHFVYLDGTPEVLRQRIGSRVGHFFGAALLQNQLEVLEPPAPDEGVVTVSIQPAPEVIVDVILAQLRAAQPLGAANGRG